MKEAIGRRLALESSRLGLTGGEAAAGACCSRRTWCYYESGRSSPDAVALARLDKLGFDVLYIITGRRDRPL
ncbi:helix-turn-helix domain-containing protein (plasmid) [Pseudomonas sp. KHPS1]|nr:helix-turn-helix domain-containing protein [Pseudomonas sp. KHPS1]UTH38939.1 helix-turn-helix domain-containing protein [Pseudomonas sp. KHPS1]